MGRDLGRAAGGAGGDAVTGHPDALAKLREPFAPEHIHKLPRATKRDAEKGHCRECGGWHGLPAIHLDYVGHAEVTARLLDADPLWAWEPVAFGHDGLPAFTRDGQGRPTGLWIRLTVGGVTRLGFGSVEPGGFDAEKQLIGDALRNAAMRFGVALDLWSKSERQPAGSAGGEEPARRQRPTPTPRRDAVPAEAPPVDTDTGEIVARPPLWTNAELKAALTEAALTVGDLSGVLGEQATPQNYAELIDAWMFAHPGKRIGDLTAAAVAYHMGAESQPALPGND